VRAQACSRRIKDHWAVQTSRVRRGSRKIIRVSSVGIATDYALDDRGGRSSSPGRTRIFLLSTSSRPLLEPTQLLFNGYLWALSPGLKQPGREADYTPPTSAEVKKRGPIHPPPIHIHGVVLNQLSIGTLPIYCHVIEWLCAGFGLVIGFTEHLERNYK
jgi:hypothetical protein